MDEYKMNKLIDDIKSQLSAYENVAIRVAQEKYHKDIETLCTMITTMAMGDQYKYKVGQRVAYRSASYRLVPDSFGVVVGHSDFIESPALKTYTIRMTSGLNTYIEESDISLVSDALKTKFPVSLYEVDLRIYLSGGSHIPYSNLKTFYDPLDLIDRFYLPESYLIHIKDHLSLIGEQVSLDDIHDTYVEDNATEYATAKSPMNLTPSTVMSRGDRLRYYTALIAKLKEEGYEVDQDLIPQDS